MKLNLEGSRTRGAALLCPWLTVHPKPGPGHEKYTQPRSNVDSVLTSISGWCSDPSMATTMPGDVLEAPVSQQSLLQGLQGLAFLQCRHRRNGTCWGLFHSSALSATIQGQIPWMYRSEATWEHRSCKAREGKQRKG